MDRPAPPVYDICRSVVTREVSSSHTVSLISEVDFSSIEAVRLRSTQLNLRKPSYTAFAVKAVAMATRKHPYANRRLYRPWWPLGRLRLQQFESCDVSVACERNFPEAESVAFFDILRDADKRPLEEITAWLYELARCDASNNKQWRDYARLLKYPRWLAKQIIHLPFLSGRLWHRYRGAAAMVSSPAKYGVDQVVGTWMHPLGISFGMVKDRAVVRNGRVEARPTSHLLLNFDRDLMAGAPAARFFQCIVEHLEQAEHKLYLAPSQERAPGTSPTRPQRLPAQAH